MLILLIHNNKVGHRINKWVAESTKWVTESTKWVTESTNGVITESTKWVWGTVSCKCASMRTYYETFANFSISHSLHSFILSIASLGRFSVLFSEHWKKWIARMAQSHLIALLGELFQPSWHLSKEKLPVVQVFGKNFSRGCPDHTPV